LRKLVVSFLLQSFLWAAAYAEPISIVVSTDSKLGSITEDDVARLYLGRSSTINDIEVTPIDFKEELPLAKEFHSKVLKKNPLQYQQYWARLLFTGKAKPPAADMETPEAMVKFISTNKGSLGYTNQKTVPADVKVILVIE
jgi:hypothetical protein